MSFSVARSVSFAAPAALLLAFSPGDAEAQSIELPQIAVEGDTIRSSVQHALEERSQSPNAKVVINSEQLNQFGDMNVGDAIRRLPGVTFPGVNRSREVKLRGIPSEYTQVLIDGRPIWDSASNRSVEIDRIPAALVERVEIIRSPMANMDSQGAAGTINIITKRQFSQPGVGISLGGGQYGNIGAIGDITAFAGGRQGKLNAFIGGGYQVRRLEESENQYTYGAGGTAPNGGNLQDQKRRFKEYSLFGRFNYEFDESNVLTIAPTYLRSEERREQSDSRLAAPQNWVNRVTDELRLRTRETIGNYAEWRHTVDKTTSFRAFLDVQKGREDTSRNSTVSNYNINGALTSQTFGSREVPVDLTYLSPGFAVNTAFGAHQLEAGGGATRRTRKETETRFSGGVPSQVDNRVYDIKETIYYGYVMDKVPVFGPDLLTFGVRTERSATITTDYLGAASSTDAVDVNPSLNYRLSALPNVDLRAGGARTLRRPDLRELVPVVTTNGGTILNPDTAGNSALKPERIWGADAGVDWYFQERTGIVSANVFGRQFEDKIETALALENGRYVSRPRNAGDGKLFGVEVEGRLPLTFLPVPGLTLWGNATAVKTELTDPLTNQTRRFAEQPDLVTNVGLDLYVRPWNTTFGINYNRTYAYSQDILQSNGQTQRTEFSALDRFDFSAKVDVTKTVTVTVGMLNLLRPTDERSLITYNANGTIASRVVSTQRSNATYYVRTSFTW
ncbi:MAG TPA: TonB-dependent receptor [Pseudolabrys sp.]|nr:TonB-dependent receptor [Pseudolabrys sp.]